MLPLIGLIPSIVSGFGTVSSLVMKYFPNAEDKAKVEAIQAEIEVIKDEVADKVRAHEEAMVNLEINKIQASSDDVFVRRARPFGLWAAAAAAWLFFFVVPLTLLVFCMVSTAEYDAVIKLIDTLGGSGYLFWVVSFIFGLFGLRGAEKGYTAWNKRKTASDACPPDEIMTYDTKAKGRVGK